MVSREIFSHDPRYESKFRETFAASPEGPVVQVYIPARFWADADVRNRIMHPIWTFEKGTILPLVISKLAADGVKGDLVEFGVFSGGAFARLLSEFKGKNVIDKFYGFDSFQGLPNFDPSEDQGFFKPGQFRATRAQAEATIAKARTDEIVELVEGWFSETLPRYREKLKSIAFCRIDCDLYSSTRDCFDFAKGRLADGAVIWFDDWTFDASTGETRAFFEFAQETKDIYTFQVLYTVSVSVMAIQVGWKSKG